MVMRVEQNTTNFQLCGIPGPFRARAFTICHLIYNLFPYTENLSDTDKFIWLMTTENPDMLHLIQQLLSSLSEERINRLKH